MGNLITNNQDRIDCECRFFFSSPVSGHRQGQSPQRGSNSGGYLCVTQRKAVTASHNLPRGENIN